MSEYNQNKDRFYGDNVVSAHSKVQQGRASFVNGTEFKFFDRISIPSSDNSQIVYKVTLSKPINLLKRVISLITGGVEYGVFPFNDGELFTGTLNDVSATKISRTNNNNHIPGRLAMPTSTHKIEKAVGTGIFTKSANDNEGIGEDILAGSTNQNSSNAIGQDDANLGYQGNSIFWLVFTKLPSVTTSSRGVYELIWEDLDL